MAATFGGSTRKKGIQILKAASAEGPFVPLTKYPVTPAEWNCLDGTFYHEKNGAVWLVFSHSVPEEPRGAICAAPLNTSMTKFTSKPNILFYMDTVSWAKPIPFAKAEFGVDGDAFFQTVHICSPPGTESFVCCFQVGATTDMLWELLLRQTVLLQDNGFFRKFRFWMAAAMV
ncbi:MAG: family 43 glycosylhydrolase [Lachnospiraceae bacterium]|nr:family 43 glycosylhydrolase [Lachnospiraceae bacterium]